MGSSRCRAYPLFDQQVAWLATQCSKNAITELMRIAWRTVGSIIDRVWTDTAAGIDAMAGLTRIGIDEISYKRGHKYLTVVVDHDSGRRSKSPTAEKSRPAVVITSAPRWSRLSQYWAISAFELAMAALRPRVRADAVDTVVEWRLDRLGRSLPHLLQTVEDLESDGVGFRSLTEAIDTTTSGGKLISSIFGAWLSQP